MWSLSLAVVAIAAGKLPPGVKPTGPLDAAYAFGDKDGVEYVLFSSKDTHLGRAIYVDHWVVGAGGKARLVRTVRDKVEDCSDSIFLRFHDDAFGVTDLDNDGIGEITFAYELGCRFDYTPNTYKLVVLERGTKYILRGTTITDDLHHGYDGGTFDPDPAEASWPRAFFAHAKDVWYHTASDSAIPPEPGASKDTMPDDPGPPDPNP